LPMDRFCIHEAPAAAWGANAEPGADAPAARPPIPASARVVCRSILGVSVRARVCGGCADVTEPTRYFD